ncbi:MAG: helix-turn-helix transcriptional regulator [Candidatus Tumulicola sp.]
MSICPTARERSLLNMLCIGMTIKQMADHFECSERAVRQSFDGLRIKFGVRTRVQLAVYAVRNGLV